MTMPKEAAYKVKDLRNLFKNESVYGAIFSDIFEGKLRGKIYMIDDDENFSDYEGGFYKSDKAFENGKEPEEPFEKIMTLRNPSRKDIKEFLEANADYESKIRNVIPILVERSREYFKGAFIAYANIPEVTAKTPISDIAKISWKRINDNFKRAYIEELYISESGLSDWSRLRNLIMPETPTASAYTPKAKPRKRNVPPELIRAAKKARNEVRARGPGAILPSGKTNISKVIDRIKVTSPELYNRWGRGTLRAHLSPTRETWDCQ